MEKIRIFCENTRSFETVALGSSLKNLSEKICPAVDTGCGCGMPVLAALVDRKLVSLDYKVINPRNVEFIGYDHPEGRRTYIRSLCFVLQNAVNELYPDKVLAVDYSLPSGLNCEIREKVSHEDGRPNVYLITDEEIANLNKINRDNTTFINSTIAITNGLNTTIPNLFETIIIAYEHLADLFDQIATINSEISNIKEQIAALTPPE